MGSIHFGQTLPVAFWQAFSVLSAFFSVWEQASEEFFAGFAPFASIFLSRPPSFPGFDCFASTSVCRILSKTKAVLCATAFFLLYISRLNLTKKEALRSAQGFRKNRSFVFFDQLAASLTRQPALMMDTCSASSGPVVKEMSSQEPSGRTKMPQIGVSVPSFSRTAGRII